ncbi:hypothetical protein V8G54_009505 [Vigna mungo]|uniref:Transcription factor CBF/NF-Y/archaeal histone domain-containing protein n=1 Tax=Vigna mungo TaxID=3915 RepID=A0AAQ3NY68_VIGMU
MSAAVELCCCKTSLCAAASIAVKFHQWKNVCAEENVHLGVDPALLEWQPISWGLTDVKQAGAYSGLLCGGISGRIRLHSLPLARIKKIMKKSGEDVKMILEDAPIIFSKACELFIEDFAQRT